MSSSHERRVVAYLKPKNDLLIRSFASVNEVSVSETVNIIVRDYFQRLPNEEKMMYMQSGKNKV